MGHYFVVIVSYFINLVSFIFFPLLDPVILDKAQGNVRWPRSEGSREISSHRNAPFPTKMVKWGIKHKAVIRSNQCNL
jgi:hypothetical protein